MIYGYTLSKDRSLVLHTKRHLSLAEAFLVRTDTTQNMTPHIDFRWWAWPFCKWGRVCQNHVSRAWIRKYISKNLWDGITYPSLWYLLLVHKSSYHCWLTTKTTPIRICEGHDHWTPSLKELYGKRLHVTMPSHCKSIIIYHDHMLSLIRNQWYKCSAGVSVVNYGCLHRVCL